MKRERDLIRRAIESMHREVDVVTLAQDAARRGQHRKRLRRSLAGVGTVMAVATAVAVPLSLHEAGSSSDLAVRAASTPSQYGQHPDKIAAELRHQAHLGDAVSPAPKPSLAPSGPVYGSCPVSPDPTEIISGSSPDLPGVVPGTGTGGPWSALAASRDGFDFFVVVAPGSADAAMEGYDTAGKTVFLTLKRPLDLCSASSRSTSYSQMASGALRNVQFTSVSGDSVMFRADDGTTGSYDFVANVLTIGQR